MAVTKPFAQKRTKDSFIDRVLEHEGFELNPYKLKTNAIKEEHFTGGVGHKMTEEDIATFDPKWSDQEKKEYWTLKYLEDLGHALNTADKIQREYNMKLNDTQEEVLAEMIFQMGEEGVKEFPKFLEAMSTGDTEEAYWQMLTTEGEGTKKSDWYIQTPKRAKKLAEIIRNS